MNSLRDMVERKIGDVLREENIETWEISGSEANCTVVTRKFTLTFEMDNRNCEVRSSVEFVDIQKEYRETLETKTIASLFPDIMWDSGLGFSNVEKRVDAEIENVKSILHKIRENSVTPRDLFYYVMGYSAGYTYVYSHPA